MRKRNRINTNSTNKKIISLFLLLAILANLLSISATANRNDPTSDQTEDSVADFDAEGLGEEAEDHLDSSEGQISNWKDKISEAVWEKLDAENEDTKVPVWIWFTDIDQEVIERQVKKETGLSIDNLAVAFTPVPNDLKRVLIEGTQKSNGQRQDEESERKLEEYIKSTSIQREEEKRRTDAYIRSKGILHGKRI